MLRLGLTGGIGSGKSTVAQMLVRQGATLIDADDIAKRCTLPGGVAMPAIVRRFGEQFVQPDGAMDRARMREHVFAYPQAKQILEHIIHPLVQQEIRRQAEASSAALTVFDIPLLVESAHWRHMLDRIVVVDCAVETQIKRVMDRNGWDRQQVEAVIAQQSSRARRLAAADSVLCNDQIDLETLRNQVLGLGRQIGL
ncbi:dephospho-CoA kinase [Hydrogenophaga sp. RWCD_12]|uniref:dephospho-CoA kinase n=1 Tax=Hydrogenophaga sp. RWCD_12 TaxID=3391190 RepID=UPI003984FE7E